MHTMHGMCLIKPICQSHDTAFSLQNVRSGVLKTRESGKRNANGRRATLVMHARQKVLTAVRVLFIDRVIAFTLLHRR